MSLVESFGTAGRDNLEVTAGVHTNSAVFIDPECTSSSHTVVPLLIPHFFLFYSFVILMCWMWQVLNGENPFLPLLY